ncbi:hypothetical protein MTR67_046048 [Solanum verrucosum]|uniref:Uncharacterized protein n=1 Tax=Solanum verrucosum TaxID=315347 RepID=A0AAF0UWN0_SOLVR|nr:hypothetical protein MTR67_046048 [Solanum verrucosum]
MAQDTAVAPTPPMETGMDTGNNGFGLPVSEAMRRNPPLPTFLFSHASPHRFSLTQQTNQKTLSPAVPSRATSSAQEIGLAPAPAPDAGAGFSLAQSGALVASSLLVSAVALLRN